MTRQDRPQTPCFVLRFNLGSPLTECPNYFHTLAASYPAKLFETKSCSVGELGVSQCRKWYDRDKGDGCSSDDGLDCRDEPSMERG